MRAKLPSENTNLGLSEVRAEVDRPGAVVHPDLHVIVADAVHDNPLELEGVAERRQLQEPLEAHALVDLGDLLQQPHQRHLFHGRQVIGQVGELLGLLNELDRSFHPVAIRD